METLTRAQKVEAFFVHMFLWATSLALLNGVACVQIIFLQQPIVPRLIGDKSISIFDMWSPGHVMMGVVLGGVCGAAGSEEHKKPPWFSGWLTVFAFLISWWEAFEVGRELNIPMEGAWELGIDLSWLSEWFGGSEHWSNRCIGDPLCAVVGCIIYRRWPQCFGPVLVAGIAYDVINLLLPHASSMQNWLFGH